MDAAMVRRRGGVDARCDEAQGLDRSPGRERGDGVFGIGGFSPCDRERGLRFASGAKPLDFCFFGQAVLVEGRRDACGVDERTVDEACEFADFAEGEVGGFGQLPSIAPGIGAVPLSRVVDPLGIAGIFVRRREATGWGAFFARRSGSVGISTI